MAATEADRAWGERKASASSQKMFRFTGVALAEKTSVAGVGSSGRTHSLPPARVSLIQGVPSSSTASRAQPTLTASISAVRSIWE